MEQFIDPSQQAQVQAPPQAQPVQQVASPQFAEGAEVAGDPQDNIRRQQASDPSGSTEVTHEEQDQYDDFMGRALALISDTRVPPNAKKPNDKSPSDATIALMNNSSKSITENVGEASARTAMILMNGAKRAKKSYDPDVVFHAGDELVASIYILGKAAGIFKGVPKLNMKQAKEGIASGNPLDSINLTDEEGQIIANAKMVATSLVGKMLLDSGQIDPGERQAAKEFWDSQVEREIETGEQDPDLSGVDVKAVHERLLGVQNGQATQ